MLFTQSIPKLKQIVFNRGCFWALTSAKLSGTLVTERSLWLENMQNLFFIREIGFVLNLFYSFCLHSLFDNAAWKFCRFFFFFNNKIISTCTETKQKYFQNQYFWLHDLQGLQTQCCLHKSSHNPHARSDKELKLWSQQ